MNPHRRRRRRRPNSIDYHLRSWAEVVRAIETGVPLFTGCPVCDAHDPRECRDRLEAVIQRGGRTGRRVVRAVAGFDRRFLRATWACPNRTALTGWWWRRDWGETS